MNRATVSCPICAEPSLPIGEKRGVRVDRVFHLARCTSCGFAFVQNPWTDYTTIYDETYYQGQGSDPLVDYVFEYQNPNRTIRIYEWKGIEQAVTILAPSARSWLDYACGNGGLVRHIANTGFTRVAGFDTGAWADRARADKLPILLEHELPQCAAAFDVITAIEVIEHITDPVAFLCEIRKLARPGALLFLTTQNASNAPRNFVDWPYVLPEIHVSFFTTQALALALEKSGFQPFYPGFIRGWDQILRFKILKNLGRREIGAYERFLPWSLIARVTDLFYKFTALPVGIAR